MKKGLFTLSGLAIITILATSGVKKVDYASGVTGQSTGCQGCHSKITTGKVTLVGLPSHVKAGGTYPFTLSFAYGSSMKYWGLDLKVSAGTIVAPGASYSGTGSNEITHANPIASTATTYSYTGLSWNTTGLAIGKVASFTFTCVGATGQSSSSQGKYTSGTFSDTIAATTLPVEFSTVNARWIGNNNVNFAFTTVNEINARYFEVERSFDNVTFIPVSKISAAGNSNSAKTYNVNDVVTGSSIAYYRIKIVDNNGEVSYSDIISVNIRPKHNFVKSMYPNPVVSGQPINLQFVALGNGTVNVELYNCLGKKVNSLTTNTVTGENDIKFNLGSFVSPGIYYVVVSNETGRISQLPVSVQ